MCGSHMCNVHNHYQASSVAISTMYNLLAYGYWLAMKVASAV
jgi:hypothetical protein